LDGKDWAAQQSARAIRAVNFFDRAERTKPLEKIDDGGSFRLKRGFALAAAGRIDDALVCADELYSLKKDDPAFENLISVLLCHKAEYEDAIKWISYALAHDSGRFRQLVMSHPTYAPLRAARKEAVADLVTVKWTWNIKWGVFNDDIILTNDSAFPLSNIVLSPVIVNEGRTYQADLKLDQLRPGEGHTFENVISVSGSKYDKASADLKSDQTP
jgi:tetratricopeptide (TPR) repeat protein